MNATLQKDSRANNERNATFVSPNVNIFETKDGYVLEAEMPGVNKEGLEITLENNELTIVGRRSDDVGQGKALFRERQLVDFRRTFELDPAIDTAKVSARIDQGV